MAKLVHDNRMVAHLWANQSQDEARSHNGNFHFAGRTLYSYNTPIAKLVEDATGALVPLFTNQSYSVTTSGHMGAAWRGVNYRGCFTVPSIGAYGGRLRSYTNGELDHAANLAYLVAQYADLKARFMKARIRPYDTSDALRRKRNTACNYAAAFGLEAPAFDVAKDAGEIGARFDRLEAADKDPVARAKREAAKAKAKARKAAREEEEARKANLEWIEGGARRPAYGGPVLLRVFTSHNGRKTLETSLGATVPLDDAIKVFRMVKLCRDTGRDWERNGASLPVGSFAVDRIHANGNFQAGCHFIVWPEVERIAGLLGLADIEGADTTTKAA